jgi:hypothetical protein
MLLNTSHCHTDLTQISLIRTHFFNTHRTMHSLTASRTARPLQVLGDSAFLICSAARIEQRYNIALEQFRVCGNDGLAKSPNTTRLIIRSRLIPEPEKVRNDVDGLQLLASRLLLAIGSRRHRASLANQKDRQRKGIPQQT